MEHSSPMFVPVHPAGPAPSCLALVTARLPDGGRVGLAFTSAEALVAAMGRGQRWVRLTHAAHRGLLAPLGVERIQVDAALVAARMRARHAA